MKVAQLAFIFIISIFCSGCGTIETHGLQHNDSEVNFGVYNGVRWDCHNADWWLLDLPFSFAGDTLFLPYDAAVLASAP
jgi:uncharacterized protein YceK